MSGQEQQLDLRQRAAAASFGAMLTALVVTPFDVAKTRMQVAAAAAAARAAETTTAAAVGTAVRHGAAELALCSRCGVWVLNNGLMEIVLTKQGEAFFTSRGSSCGVPAPPPNPPASSTVGTMSRIARTEGLTGLYAGFAPTLLMAVPNTVLYFTAYDELRALLDDRLGTTRWAAPGVAGAVARLVAATAVAPFELVRTQLQATATRSSYSHFRRLLAARGAAGLWRGLSPTLWRDVPFSAIYWLAYERINKQQQNHGRSASSRTWRALVSGLGAGALAAAVTTPFDVAKTRQMVDLHTSSSAQSQTTTWALLGKIARTEGPAALFAGAFPRLIKVAPACAIMVGTYEYAKALFALTNQHE